MTWRKNEILKTRWDSKHKLRKTDIWKSTHDIRKTKMKWRNKTEILKWWDKRREKDMRSLSKQRWRRPVQLRLHWRMIARYVFIKICRLWWQGPARAGLTAKLKADPRRTFQHPKCICCCFFKYMLFAIETKFRPHCTVKCNSNDNKSKSKSKRDEMKITREMSQDIISKTSQKWDDNNRNEKTSRIRT